MALILCMETTTTNCSVSLVEKGKTIALKEDRSAKYSHAEKLHVFVETVVEAARKKLTDLNAVAVSKGPGSYTGLRIGVSAAKGLCFALNIPLLSTSTLKLLALQARVEKEPYDFVIPLMDARRMEVYTAVYDRELRLVESISAKILDENSYASFLEQGKVLFTGNGVEKFQEICISKNAFFKESLPSAKEMETLVKIKFQQMAFEDTAYFEPYYLKDFVVKMKKKKSS